MASQTVTRIVESDFDPEPIYRKLTDGALLPKWAPAFADSSHAAGNGVFRMSKGDKTFDVDLIANESAMTVDYLFDMNDGKRGGAYLRVMPRPINGSVVTMTVPLAPNADPDQVAAVLEQELNALIRLV